MSENVQVAVRMRPFNEREKSMDSVCCLRMVKDTQQTIITDPETNIDKAFTFDYSYNSFVSSEDPEYASQDTMWDDIGVKVLEHAWNGFNVSLFAYGQTGSGKSYSMVGYGSDKGIIPRASEVIFQRIEATTDSGIVFKVEASMMEIYNERAKDLFNPSSDNLKIRDHPRQGPYAEGLTRHAVSSYNEISRLMDAGILARTTASTNMNATSSRAHTIFQIVVTQSEMNPSTNKVMDKVSRINLIDLAGSERAASTGATGTRLKEGAAINQSLSALGNCISALADIANGKKKVLVPYRNSKLTHLLKDSLGGNSKTIMIAALSPASVNYSETLSTLRYADRAKQIKNQAIVNEDPNQMLIRQLKEELEALRKAMSENADPGSRPQSRGGFDAEGDAGEFSRRERDPEKEREILAIKEQLEEHQRLLRESEKSWQERLRETEELARKREEQLKSLGLATNGSELKERALKEPHLLNLNEDQLMSEKLLYFLNTGANRVGRADSPEDQNVVIGGLGVLREHCIITRHVGMPENDSDQSTSTDVLTIRAMEAAKILINGEPLTGSEEDVVLRHCDRLILGNANVFRIVIPSARPAATTPEEIAKESVFDWQLAMKELNTSQIRAALELEAQAEKEKQEMDTRVKHMEEMMQTEQRAAEEKLRQQREEWERHVRQLTESMKLKELEIHTQMLTEGEQDKRRLAEQLAQQETRLAEELVKAEMSFEKKQEELVRKQQELEQSLQKQMREAKVMSQLKDRERIERLKFDDQLLYSIPLVDEANTIADELQNHTRFAIKLMTCGPSSEVLSHSRSGIREDEEMVIGCGITAELKVQVTFQEAGTYRQVEWDIDQFQANVYAMREIYQIFIENNRVVDPSLWKHIDPDPFYDPPQPQLIGKAFVYFPNIYYGCKVSDLTPIFDYRGIPCGSVKWEMMPTILSLEWQTLQHELVDSCPDDWRQLQLPTLSEFIDSNIRLNLVVDGLREIPGKLCKEAFVKIRWEHGQEVEYVSTPAAGASVDPKIDYAVMIETRITSELITYIQNHPLEIQVFGIVPSSNLNKVASRALNDAAADNGDDVSSNSITFFDVDGERRSRLKTKKSMRKRNGRGHNNQEDPSTLLQKYTEQLAVQERALAENTQELEAKTHEVEHLSSQLDATHKERNRLRDALEEMARTNKLLQVKLEQQIMKESVTKLLNERRKTIALKSDIHAPTTAPEVSPARVEPNSIDLNARIKAALLEDADEALPAQQVGSVLVATTAIEPEQATMTPGSDDSPQQVPQASPPVDASISLEPNTVAKSSSNPPAKNTKHQHCSVM